MRTDVDSSSEFPLRLSLTGLLLFFFRITFQPTGVRVTLNNGPFTGVYWYCSYNHRPYRFLERMLLYKIFLDAVTGGNLHPRTRWLPDKSNLNEERGVISFLIPSTTFNYSYCKTVFQSIRKT